MRSFRPLALALVFIAGAGVAASAHSPDQPSDELRLPERLDRALRDMMQDLKPALDEALDYMRSFRAIDDRRYYEMPEVLPNGDIIIRRKPDAPEFRPPEPDEPAPAEPPFSPEEGIRT